MKSMVTEQWSGHFMIKKIYFGIKDQMNKQTMASGITED